MLLSTRRSPALRKSPRAANRAWTTASCSPEDTRRRESPRLTGGSCATSSSGRSKSKSATSIGAYRKYPGETLRRGLNVPSDAIRRGPAAREEPASGYARYRGSKTSGGIPSMTSASRTMSAACRASGNATPGPGSRSKWRQSGRSGSSQGAYHWFKSMHPRFTTHRSEARSSITGKSMILRGSRPIAHVRSQSGRGEGARFMKKGSLPAPLR